MRSTKRIGIQYFMIVFLGVIWSEVTYGGEMIFQLVSNGGNCNDCEWISAQGDIVTSTPTIFKKFITNHQNKKYSVSLHSSGGNLIAGLKLGILFRKYEIRTSIDKTVKDGQWFSRKKGYCISACAYAFLGGKTRIISHDQALGLHQFYDRRAMKGLNVLQFTGQDRVTDQFITGTIVRYLIEMGVKLDLYVFAASVPPKSVRFVSANMAITWNIDNSTEGTYPWKLLAFKKGLVSQIDTKRTGRRLRFYCSGKGVYLTFFIPVNHNNVRGEDIERAFTSTKGKLTFEKYPGIIAHFKSVIHSKSKKTLIVVFVLSKESVQKFITLKKITIDYATSDLPRYLYPIMELFSFGKIGGTEGCLYWL